MGARSAKRSRGVRRDAGGGPQLSVVLPCLNEARTVGICVREARAALARVGISGEVLVADNGSVDSSVRRARKAGARVVHVPERGYGEALRGGMAAARGKWLMMADADCTYDFSSLGDFVAGLRRGCDLVQGSRLRGRILPGAMPWTHRWIGTPFFNFLLRLLFGLRVSDSQCGMRAFTRKAYGKLKMRSGGMEFASEMLAKAARLKLEVSEVPIRYRPDRRNSPPHLRAFSDGWRHLRLILLMSPVSVLLGPGVALLLFGLVLVSAALARISVFGYPVGFHFAILGSALLLIGYQVTNLGLAMSLLRGKSQAVWPRRLLQVFSIERTLLTGAAFGAAGFLMGLHVLVYWLKGEFASFSTAMTMQGIIGMTLILLAVAIIFGGFFTAVLLSTETEDWGL